MIVSKTPLRISFADINRLKAITDWQPSFSIKKGIQSTIEYLNQNRNMGT